MYKFSYVSLLAAAMITGVTGLSGCGNQVQFALSPTGQSFQQNSNLFQNKIDILWVIDNSGSMSPLQTKLTSNFSAAINAFQARGYDFQMAVTTTDAYKAGVNFSNLPSLAKFVDGTDLTSHTGVFVIGPATPNFNSTFVINATQGANGSGDERAFSSFQAALSSPLNSGFHRSGAFLAVIILSDEDDFSGALRPEGSWLTAGGIPDHDYAASTLDPVSQYVSYLDGLTQSTGASRMYNVSSIAVLDEICMASHIADSVSTIVGLRYIALAQATNGVTGSICDANFANSLTAIASQIVTLSTQFYLQRTPVVSSIVVYDNDKVVSEDSINGWTFSSASNSIQFHGSAVPAQGANVRVVFAPDSVAH